MTWLGLALALTVQQIDSATVIFRRGGNACTLDSAATAKLDSLRADLRAARGDSGTHGVVSTVTRWGPLVLTGLTLIAVLATRTKTTTHEHTGEWPRKHDDDDH